MLKKGTKALPAVFIARATLKDYEQKTPEEVKEWVEATIKQISTDQPLYWYEKSVFEYTHEGHIDFKFRFVLKKKGSMLRAVK